MANEKKNKSGSTVKNTAKPGDKLRSGKKQFKPKTKSKRDYSKAIITEEIHRNTAKANEDDNAGTDSANRSLEFAEDAVHHIQRTSSRQNKGLKDAPYGEKLKKTDTSLSDAKSASGGLKKGDQSSNPLSKWWQKASIKKAYSESRNAAEAADKTAAATKKAGKKTGSLLSKLSSFSEEQLGKLVPIGIIGLVILFLVGTFSSCSLLGEGGTNAILGSSYTAEDADIIGANNDYSAKEAALQAQINSIESTHPGYDELFIISPR